MGLQRFKYNDVFKVDSNFRGLTSTNLRVNQRAKKRISEKFKGKNLYRLAIKKSELLEEKGESHVIEKVSIKPKKIFTRVPVIIEGISVGPDINILDSDSLFGLSIEDNLGQDVSGHIENGVLIIRGFCK